MRDVFFPLYEVWGSPKRGGPDPRNISGVGSPTRGAGIGHVDFMLFMPISFVLVSQCTRSF